MNTRQSDLELLGTITGDNASGATVETDGPPPFRDDEQFTPEWCTEALHAGGALGGGRVTSVQATSLGPDTPGFLGQLCRLHLEYDDAAAGPPSLVAKRNSPEEFNRGIASGMGFYLREFRVYRELAPAIPLRMARHYYSALEEDRFVLLLEDLGAARVGRQSDATTVDDLGRVIDELAQLHGQCSGNAAFDLDWIPRVDAMAAVYDAALATRWPGFVDGFASGVHPDAVEIGHRLQGRVHEVLGAMASGAATVVHGDFRIDNVLFDAPPEPERPVVIDWQSIARGRGAFDVAQIISLSLEPATRRAAEADLLARYAAVVGGITGVTVSADDLYEEYRMALLFPFVMGVAQTDMDTAQAGSDGSIWLQRASEAVADHGLPTGF